MELDEVPAKALGVEGVELRRISVARRPSSNISAAPQRCPKADKAAASAGAVRAHGVHQRRSGENRLMSAKGGDWLKISCVSSCRAVLMARSTGIGRGIVA